MIGWSHIVCKSPYLFHDDQELASCFTDDGGCADPSVYQRDFLKYLRYNLLAYQTTLPESKKLSQKKKYSNTVYRYTWPKVYPKRVASVEFVDRPDKLVARPGVLVQNVNNGRPCQHDVEHGRGVTLLQNDPPCLITTIEIAFFLEWSNSNYCIN